MVLMSDTFVVTMLVVVKQEGMNVNFDYTAPSTSQQNRRAETKFATLLNWVHAILNGRKFYHFFRNGLRAESATTDLLLKYTLLQNPWS